jgi:hypothetical protein
MNMIKVEQSLSDCARLTLMKEYNFSIATRWTSPAMTMGSRHSINVDASMRTYLG